MWRMIRFLWDLALRNSPELRIPENRHAQPGYIFVCYIVKRSDCVQILFQTE